MFTVRFSRTQCRSILCVYLCVFCAVAINLQNSGDVSHLEGEKDISRLQKKDKVKKNETLGSRVVRPGNESRKEHEIERLRSIARRLARDAEKFLTVEFSLFHFQWHDGEQERAIAYKKRRYTRDTPALLLLPANRRFLYATKYDILILFIISFLKLSFIYVACLMSFEF